MGWARGWQRKSQRQAWLLLAQRESRARPSTMASVLGGASLKRSAARVTRRASSRVLSTRSAPVRRCRHRRHRRHLPSHRLHRHLQRHLHRHRRHQRHRRARPRALPSVLGVACPRKFAVRRVNSARSRTRSSLSAGTSSGILRRRPRCLPLQPLQRSKLASPLREGRTMRSLLRFGMRFFPTQAILRQGPTHSSKGPASISSSSASRYASAQCRPVAFSEQWPPEVPKAAAASTVERQDTAVFPNQRSTCWAVPHLTCGTQTCSQDVEAVREDIYSPPPPLPPRQHGSNTGLIVGIVLLCVGLLTCIGCCVVCKNKRRAADDEYNSFE